LLMAYVGTLLGAVAALVLCFFASKNITSNTVVVVASRRFLEFSRTVPEMVFALIFVVAFSLGPLPGVLALAIHTGGALGKLFAEVVENIDLKPVDGIVASGGTWLQKVRFGVLPQVASNFASYALLRFEINVRGAAVLGFVGAGGIGQTLLEVIRKFYYSDISALLVMIVVTVMLIDAITERVRYRLLGEEAKQ
jgi:phosphonate transport system permease protein